jgi:exodeoxyribonuclease VII small subunit
MATEDQTEFAEMTFEQAFARLQEVVNALDTGDLSLDEAMTNFETGMKLARYCERLLGSAELRVQQLLADSAGNLTLAPFETDS